MNQSTEVTVERNPIQVTNCPTNFTVVEADGWDLGGPIGRGATESAALEDFISDFMLKRNEEVSLTIKGTFMKIPQLHVINYAGFMDLKDEPYYEAKSVLNVEDYPEAELIAEEIARRCNCHTDLLEALEKAWNFIKVFSGKHNAVLGKDWKDAMNAGVIEMEAAIKKARGL